MSLLSSVSEKITSIGVGISYNDIFSNVGNSLSTFTGKVQGISLGIVVTCIVIIGLMFMFGEGPSRAAKKWLMYVIVGCFLVFGAATLGSTIKDVTGF